VIDPTPQTAPEGQNLPNTGPGLPELGITPDEVFLTCCNNDGFRSALSLLLRSATAGTTPETQT
jgi:hypothetical protein